MDLPADPVHAPSALPAQASAAHQEITHHVLCPCALSTLESPIIPLIARHGHVAAKFKYSSIT